MVVNARKAHILKRQMAKLLDRLVNIHLAILNLF
jgi:hypothetical protein